MIASAATASEMMSGTDRRDESPRAPAVSGLAGDARTADAAVRMDSKSFRAISSFQAGSCKKRSTEAEWVRYAGLDLVCAGCASFTKHGMNHDGRIRVNSWRFLLQTAEYWF